MNTANTPPAPEGPTLRCPIRYAVEVLGDRWTLLLVRDMLLMGKRRYSEFLGSAEGISTNILASRLKELQAQGLLEKFPNPKDRKASIYLLTDKGIRLAPLMLELIRWGMEHDEHTDVPKYIREALNNSQQNLMEILLESMGKERAALQ